VGEVLQKLEESSGVRETSHRKPPLVRLGGVFFKPSGKKVWVPRLWREGNVFYSLAAVKGRNIFCAVGQKGPSPKGSGPRGEITGVREKGCFGRIWKEFHFFKKLDFPPGGRRGPLCHPRGAKGVIFVGWGGQWKGI